MSQRCVICGKQPVSGQNKPHSQKRTKRRFMPNLQRIKVMLNGKVQRVKVCTSCIKANKVVRVISKSRVS